MSSTIATYIAGVLVAWTIAFGERLIAKYIPVAEAQKLAAEKQIASQEIADKQGLAYDGVRLAEDLYTTLDGQAKLQKAVAWMAAEATKRGITVTPDEIEQYARIAYQDFAGKIDVAPVPAPATK
jgi:hypothetical protein